LAAAIPRNGVSGGDYWAQQGESFVSAYMALAGLSELLPPPPGEVRDVLTIQRLAAWAFLGVGITDPIVNDLVRRGLEAADLETQLLAKAAALKLTALHREDPRIRASIYATARLAFEAWSEPSVAHSASLDPRDSYHADVIWEHRPRFVDLDWLMGDRDDGRTNTLYLIAPDAEFDRLAPVLGGLLGDLREQIHAGDIDGRRLAKPLLFVIDEAAQLELKWLPQEVSTIAGLGGIFVTCWQSKAQIDSHYGSLSDAVLGGHRSKVVFTGCDDPATLDWLGKVAGTEHVARRSWSADTGGGRRTISEGPQREDLVGPHVVRQMWPGEAVLLHGTLPPVHLRSVQWWKDRTLRQLVPTDDHGTPIPVRDGTCPVSDQKPQPGDAGLEASALQESASHLPPPAEQDGLPPSPAAPWRPNGARPNRATPARTRPTATRDDTGRPGTGQLSLLPPASPPNRHAGACRRCDTWVNVGSGHAVPYGKQDVVVCKACAEAGTAAPRS
jgi:type IV secretion system protein VirD4